MGSRISWQKVLGSFFPSGLVADLLNLPEAGSKYLGKRERSNQKVSVVHICLPALQSLLVSGLKFTKTRSCSEKDAQSSNMEDAFL